MADSAAVIDHLVAQLALGRVRSVAFVVPGDVTCTLPLYEVAIKTARSGWRIGVPHALYWFVTPEPSPLACYGAAMTAAAHQRLEPEGITFIGSTYAAIQHGAVLLDPQGGSIEADQVVALDRGGWFDLRRERMHDANRTLTRVHRRQSPAAP